MRVLHTTVALALALLLASCGGSDPEQPARAKAPVRIGTMNFTESQILGELYGQALQAKGLRVELQSAVGPREITNRALRQGLLDMYPEYIGVLLSEVHKVEARPTSAAEAYRLAKRLEERRDFTLLDPTKLSNDNALAVKQSFGRKNDVAGIPDLKRERAVLGAAPEFRTRFEGLIGLERLYGLKFRRFEPVNIGKGLQYPALNDGKIDVAVVFTTDPQLARGRYTVLRDPEGVFAVNHVAPLISQKVLKDNGPKLAAALDAVSALLTTPVMRAMNAKVDIDKRTPREVADEFLRAQSLK